MDRGIGIKIGDTQTWTKKVLREGISQDANLWPTDGHIALLSGGAGRFRMSEGPL